MFFLKIYGGFATIVSPHWLSENIFVGQNNTKTNDDDHDDDDDGAQEIEVEEKEVKEERIDGEKEHDEYERNKEKNISCAMRVCLCVYCSAHMFSTSR